MSDWKWEKDKYYICIKSNSKWFTRGKKYKAQMHKDSLYLLMDDGVVKYVKNIDNNTLKFLPESKLRLVE